MQPSAPQRRPLCCDPANATFLLRFALLLWIRASELLTDHWCKSSGSRRSLRSSRNAGERADRGSGVPGAELLVTGWNEAVNFLHMLDEGMKTVTETAFGGPAERSGIFPQPEAVCQKCSVFLALSLCPKPLDSYIPQFLLVLLQNHISQCHFFLTVIILSFTWPTVLRGPVPTGHKSLNLE